MSYLLDTQILLWALTGNPKLKPSFQKTIENNQTFFSAVSVWEVAIKVSRGYVDELIEPVLFYETLINSGYIELPITGQHCAYVRNLPFIHKDPLSTKTHLTDYSSPKHVLNN